MPGEAPEFFVRGFFAGVFGDGEEARQDADDVAVEDGRGLVEGDAGDRPGGVGADAGQLEYGGVGAREFAVVAREDFAGGLLHVADAGVIAEAFPEFVDGGGVGVGEGWDVGQRAHPAFPIGDDSFDLGLLEHDFGNPDGVGIRGASPREVAGLRRKPF